jgi:general secretion pathway protein K
MMAAQSLHRPEGGALRNERGVALLIVLVIVALLTIIVTEFTYSVQIDQHRTRNAIHALQAQLLARSGVNLSEGFLLLDDDATYDAYSEDWWLQLIQFCKDLQLDESMRIRCRVRDESGKLNINNTRGVVRRFATDQVTADAVLRDALRCIFQNHNISLEYVDKLVDYWQKEPELKSDGTPAQIPDFTSLEDVGATLGIPSEQLHQLRNLLTAQPTQNARLLPNININTAPPEVLAAVLTDNAPQDCGANETVEAIIQRQMDVEQPFRTTGDINGVIKDVKNVDIKRRLFGVRSRLFRLEASALTNVDPNNPTSGGIGQTLSVLVSRTQGSQPRSGAAPQVGANGQPVPSWTLRPLDWQKEGGARLFRTSLTDDSLPGSQDDQEEPDSMAPSSK